MHCFHTGFEFRGTLFALEAGAYIQICFHSTSMHSFHTGFDFRRTFYALEAGGYAQILLTYDFYA